jgi:hypothetical protein
MSHSHVMFMWLCVFFVAFCELVRQAMRQTGFASAVV